MTIFLNNCSHNLESHCRGVDSFIFWSSFCVAIVYQEEGEWPNDSFVKPGSEFKVCEI